MSTHIDLCGLGLGLHPKSFFLKLDLHCSGLDLHITRIRINFIHQVHLHILTIVLGDMVLLAIDNIKGQNTDRAIYTKFKCIIYKIDQMCIELKSKREERIYTFTV